MIRFKLIFVTSLLVISFIKLSISQDLNLTVKVKKGKYGYINKKGKKVIDYTYTYAEPFSEGFAVVEHSLRFGYINSLGEIEIPIQFYDAGEFSEGFAYVSKNKKYGYINNQGDIIIDYIYNYAESFHNGFAIVHQTNPDTNKYGGSLTVQGLINSKNELLSGEWFNSISFRDNSSYLVTQNEIEYILFNNGTKKEKKKRKEKPNIADKNLIPGDVIKNPDNSILTLPGYHGGVKALKRYLLKNLKYPYSASLNNKQGKVFVTFVISKKGEIKYPRVLKPLHPLLNKEAIRVIREMPLWIPGEKDGVPITTKFNMPIVFRLK
jgi:TonB family protein